MLKNNCVIVISNGADGAGPFLKAMTSRSGLFQHHKKLNVPPHWTFFLMPQLRFSGLSCQDIIHLLAKLRTRLLKPSNLIIIGVETACRGHLEYLLKAFPKSKHGLTHKMLENKDKQNYSSIEILISAGVKECLEIIEPTIKTKGTLIILWLIKNIRDTFFDKSISPLERISCIWKVIFFLRIWRVWLHLNNYTELDHFITRNAYICTELNGHLVLNILYNVIQRNYPPEALRVWTYGSQACEQTFRLLRSMTPIFSTIVNFSMKGLLERIHKLNYLSSVESSQEILFPRVKRRLLHLKEEGEKTFTIPTINEVENCILAAKMEAIKISKNCGMNLDRYGDEHLFLPVTESIITQYEQDSDLVTRDSEGFASAESSLPHEEVVKINEDISQVLLAKKKSTGIPTYLPSSSFSGRKYSLKNKSSKSLFVKYQGVFIRKSTALYLLQENNQLSNDRLLRVRSIQPSHLFNKDVSNGCNNEGKVNSGDLCFFRRMDSDKVLIGRVVQFSYLEGSKKQREYSSLYVDLTLDSYTCIGAFANWFQVIQKTVTNELIGFAPLDNAFTIGYISMRNYISTIKESVLQVDDTASFCIHVATL